MIFILQSDEAERHATNVCIFF